MSRKTKDQIILPIDPSPTHKILIVALGGLRRVDDRRKLIVENRTEQEKEEEEEER